MDSAPGPAPAPTPPPPAPAPAPGVQPVFGPDHRDLYILVIGIILGICVGPAVLGRLRPTMYQRAFVGAEVQRQRLATAEQFFKDRQARLASSDASPAATQEFEQAQEPQLMALRALAQQALEQHRDHLRGLLNALVAATLGLMVVEAVVDVRARSVRARLAMARYVLLALWLALALACPALVWGMSGYVAVGIFIAAMFAALIPLGSRQP